MGLTFFFITKTSTTILASMYLRWFISLILSVSICWRGMFRFSLHGFIFSPFLSLLCVRNIRADIILIRIIWYFSYADFGNHLHWTPQIISLERAPLIRFRTSFSVFCMCKSEFQIRFFSNLTWSTSRWLGSSIRNFIYHHISCFHYHKGCKVYLMIGIRRYRMRR